MSNPKFHLPTKEEAGRSSIRRHLPIIADSIVDDGDSHVNGIDTPPPPRVFRRTENMVRYSKYRLRLDSERLRHLVDNADEDNYLNARAPTSYGECESQRLGAADNPCPWVRCKYHLFIDVNPDNGSICFRFPDKELDELTATCALHEAAHGPTPLELIGGKINVTRERVRQIESNALRKMANAHGHLRDYLLDMTSSSPPVTPPGVTVAMAVHRGR